MMTAAQQQRQTADTPQTAPLVCLIKTDNRVYRNIPPLGMLYLGNALRKAGFRVKIYHILEDEIEACAAELTAMKPVFAGFSVVTGWGIRPSAQLSRQIKQRSDIPVVWGNVHPSHMPQQCLKEDYIDIVALGEGEDTIVELARALAEGRNLRGIPGIGFCDGDEIILNEQRTLLSEIDKYEPDWNLVDIERYIAPCWGIERTLRVTASRGCPFNCSFCYNQAFNRRQWRKHSADYIVNQLNRLADEKDIGAFYFNDDNFFVDQTWAWTILEAIQRPYYVSLRAELMTPEFARRLAETGCRELLIGFESGSDRVLKEVLNKGATAAANMNAIKQLSKYPEVQVTASFITGVPGESEEEFMESVQMMCRFLEMHSNIRVIVAFYRPMPGTDLYEEAIKQGFAPPDTTEGWSDFDALSNTLDLPWLDEERSRKTEALCQAMDILAALYKFKVPILKGMVRRQILTGDCRTGWLAMVNRIRVAYAFGDDNHTGVRLLRRVVDRIKRIRHLD